MAVKLLVEMKLAPIRHLELARIFEFTNGTQEAVQELASHELVTLEEAEKIGLAHFYAVVTYRTSRSGPNFSCSSGYGRKKGGWDF